MSDRTRENRERRKAERLRQREEGRQGRRKSAALERRLQDEAESAREEERRQEARAEWEAVTAAIEATRQQQETLRQRLRRQHLEQQRAAEKREQQHAARHPPGQLERDEARRKAREQARQERAEERRKREQRRQQAQPHRRSTPPPPSPPEPGDKPAREPERDTAPEPDREARPEDRQARREADREAKRQADREAKRSADRRSRKSLAQRVEERRAAREAERRARHRQEQKPERPASARPELPPRDPPEEPEAEPDSGSEAPALPSRESTPARPLLQARIPGGELSGALPWLRVVGPQLLTTDDRPVILRGIGLLGLDLTEVDPDDGFAPAIAAAEEALAGLLAWRPNVVRLAINRDRVLSSIEGVSGWDYLDALDQVIARAAAGGAYTMLSLRRLSDDAVFGTRGGVPNPIAPQPDADTIGMWRVLGERYAEEPAVLFDLFTAPHAALPDDLTGFDTSWTLWTTWVQMMVADLRQSHPRSVCFVCGLDWGADLSGFPVIGTGGAPLVNLVYAGRLAPDGTASWPALRALARSHPVFISEWAAGPSVLSAEQTAVQLRGSGLGFAAAPWNGEAPLASSRSGRVVPTPFGLVVQRALALADAAPAVALARPFPTSEPAAPIPLE